MDCCQKDWLDVVNLFAIPGAALAAALAASYISFLQWRTADATRKQVYKQDYLSVYQKLIKAISCLNREACPSMEEITLLNQALEEARLFLKLPVADYVKSIRDNVCDLWVVQQELSSAPVGSKQRTELCRREAEFLKAIAALKPHEEFRKYIPCDK